MTKKEYIREIETIADLLNLYQTYLLDKSDCNQLICLFNDIQKTARECKRSLIYKEWKNV